MVTAGNGTVILHGVRSGKDYAYNFYSSDVLAAYCTFSVNGVAVAGSTNFVGAPEDCFVKDISFANSNTVTTNLVFQRNEANAGPVPIAGVLTTITVRAVPNIQYRAGDKIAILQA